LKQRTIPPYQGDTLKRGFQDVSKRRVFPTVESNAKTQKEAEEDFKREVIAFQEDTKKLILEIKEWFAGSPVTASVGTMQVI
jgi:hypothetical protein